MAAEELGRLAYLVALGSVVIFYFLVSHRQPAGRTLRHVLLWGLIFTGVIAAWALWPDIRDAVLPRQSAREGRLVVPLAPDGHYYLNAEVNGARLRFMIDTGATGIVLDADDAARAGFDPDTLDYAGRAATANGTVRIARVRIDRFRVGPITDRGVPAAVSAGDMPASLLGMGYLARFRSVEIGGGRMILTR